MALAIFLISWSESMKWSAIIHIIGMMLEIEGLLMGGCALVGLYYGEPSGLYFLGGMVMISLIGAIMRKIFPQGVYYAREGFIIVSLGWIVMSLAGALPFFLSGQIPNYADACFETISGFTTTGASILNNVEGLDKCMLFWRSLTHWIGGMGILVFMLAVLPMTGGYNMHLMKVESPGPTVDKLVPKVSQTARILYAIYFAMTVAEIIILRLGGMHLFDCVTISFGTAGTGGFGVLNDSCASYSAFCQVVTGIFMVLFGVNFNVLYLVAKNKWKDALSSTEVRVYFGIILGATVTIALSIMGMYGGIARALKEAFFQVSSIITTTGFSTADFDMWPAVSKMILFMLMFVGACASSTGGGIKVSRILIGIKIVKREILTFVHPKVVKGIKLDGRKVDKEVERSVAGYFILYFVIMGISCFLVSVDGFDFETNVTSVAATLNNIGPGFSKVGPMGNFADFSVFSKIVLMFDMLAGRLELFPMIVLLFPRLHRR